MNCGALCSLKIAGIPLTIETQHPLEVTDRFRPFLHGEEWNGYRLTFRETDALPEFLANPIFEGNSYRVYQDGCGGFLRAFFDPVQSREPYGVGQYDWSRRRIAVSYLPQGAPNVSRIENCFFHLGWETLLLRERRLILHASLVETDLGGILFSGPSGIGKSMQADLWCRYRSARLLNGDRPILQRRDGVWLAWGAPYAGSSRCYVNKSCAVRAIVLLEQASSCSLRRLGAAEAFRRIYAGLTLNSWDPKSVSSACDLALTLVREVPVFSFRCTKEENAVTFLEGELRKVTDP